MIPQPAFLIHTFAHIFPDVCGQQNSLSLSPHAMALNLLFHFDVDVDVLVRNVGVRAVPLPVADQIRYHPCTLIVRPVSVVVGGGVNTTALRVSTTLQYLNLNR